MVNPTFVGNFQGCVQKELGPILAGPPGVYRGGEAMDHYRGLANTVLNQLLSVSEAYEPTEFLYGYIPMRTPALPYVFFQFPVLDVKGRNIPGAAHFAAVVQAPIPGTIVTPQLGFKSPYLPLSAVLTPDFRPKDKFDLLKRSHDVFKHRAGWYPLLESLNGDKAARKASSPSWQVSTIGRFEIRVNANPIGLTQLAPYKGRTILTMQRVPTPKAAVDKPLYDLKGSFEGFSIIAAHVHRQPQIGQEVGDLFMTRSNRAMMDLVLRQIDAAPPSTPSPRPA